MFSINNTTGSTTTDTKMYGKLKRYWRRNRYQRLYPADYGTVSSYDDEALLSSRQKRYSKVARFGSGGGDTHQNNKNMGPMRRRMGMSLKMRLKRFVVTPVVRILGRIRNGYIDMMLGITGDVGNGVFGGKRIPKARQVEGKKNKKKVSNSDMEQFETKLVYEIYKVLAASRQFSTIEAANKYTICN